MDENVVLCAVCAWRGMCSKKYSVSGIEIFNCPDFVRDVSLSVSGLDELLSLVFEKNGFRVN
ncbi:MAG: hypothetical protein EVJ46_05760 [Candidatus Acididesulfobacter guangdongensis]|uniref:Uncharacterized protein n=1 Tax=Acididesulfobacter guangdongensis TaxID=2597225 RepID=A0A519BGY3_ACIG2|nr:MAG: hypothetical protein EVJ46_05760 [Candidatus Acididesulfobacter guangdongensis]